MGRPLRLEFSGGLYHLTSRGDRREDIYESDDDRIMFLKILGEVCLSYNWVSHSYCLMTNHYHLLIETPDANLSQGMRQLNGVYSQKFNRNHKRVGHVEAGVGEGIAACVNRGLLERSELYLQSKFTALDGQDPKRIPYNPQAGLGEQVAQSFQISLQNLQTHYLDCLVLHSPLATPQHTHEVWVAMESLVHEGGVKQLGISNCYDLKILKDLYAIATIKPAVIQNRFYADTGYDRTLREYCRQHAMIYQSFWTLTANPQLLEDSCVRDLAAELQRSPAQVFFRYLTQIGIVPLTGTTSTAHMQEDLAIFGFELSAEQCAAIEALL